jgi:hypothetical protein
MNDCVMPSINTEHDDSPLDADDVVLLVVVGVLSEAEDRPDAPGLTLNVEVLELDVPPEEVFEVDVLEVDVLEVDALEVDVSER